VLPETRKAYPSTLHGTNDGTNGSAARAAQRMVAAIDTFAAYTVLTVDAHAKREERRDDACERARRRDHEHDDHLQPCGLQHVGAAEDRAGHHARYRDDARHAGPIVS